MEFAIIFFIVAVGLLVLIPVIGLVIQKITDISRKKKKRSSSKTSHSEKTTPVKETNYSYQPAVIDSASYGEYKIYEELKFYERQGCKFLSNVYLPKNNGETTEIDLLMISPKGIFVFESKNYDGSIEGSEKNQYWNHIKTDECGKIINEKFYNPVLQNKVHITSLREIMKSEYAVFSIVVFSDKCILKYDTSSISEDSEDAQVITLNDLTETVEAHFKYMKSDMSDTDIEMVYNKLYPYTQVSDEDKLKHIKNIKDKYSNW